MTIFNKNAPHHMEAKMFFDEGGGLGIARYDTAKYPDIARLAKKQREFFWTPEEIDVIKDGADFSKLAPHEQHIFTANLKRQILLDSVQGRAPSLMFAPVTSLPEMENLATTWTFFEEIHSESYTHIIRNVYNVSSEVFDQMVNIPEIVDCAEDISRYYDDYEEMMHAYKLAGFGEVTIQTEDGKKKTINVDRYEIKKKLWLMLMSINVLEGLRFYVSFACSWAFAETKRMEGNAKIIRFICRDENLHLSATQKLLKVILPKDDPDFAKIRDETVDECMAIFHSAIRQEKAWARYLFKDGSIIGLNEELLDSYIDFLAIQRMRAVGLKPDFTGPTTNPLPWTYGWITSAGVQEAPQETEKSSYLIGGVIADAGRDAFKKFEI